MGKFDRIKRFAKADLHQVVIKRLIVPHRPCAEQPKESVLHLARGSLGIGEAKDLFGRNTFQQQKRHSVGQHFRFSRPCICRQPGRSCRIGGPHLRLAGFILHAHDRSSRTGVAARSHSPNRES